MSVQPINETELIGVARELLHAMISREEGALEKFNTLIAPEFVGYGLGKDDILKSRSDYSSFFSRGKNSFSDIQYQMPHIEPKIMGNIGIVEGELSIIIKNEQEVNKTDIRFTLVFVYGKEGCKCMSSHISVPLPDQTGSEGVSTENLKATNEELKQMVSERTSLLQHRSEELQEALHSLKAAQIQLVQQEKLASLGELTAGIAHEIRNPLNFVNNFAEVDVDLSEELKAEIEKSQISQDEKEKLRSLINEMVQNQQKIIFHGKRADAIVKSMLQHSRNSTGEKEATDINALVDEYLRLSYYGLRAKDKNFNVTLRTNFDDRIEAVKVVSQDLGRVLLNLFNNAFYSVTEKKKKVNGLYHPMVSVTTKKEENNIQICIRDNGLGISQIELEKIFQPFFTTKPTGEGTGLGLSLSYDIITKEHGGEIKVNSEEGTYAEFVILLPA